MSSLFRVMVRMDTPGWNYILGGWNYLRYGQNYIDVCLKRVRTIWFFYPQMVKLYSHLKPCDKFITQFLVGKSQVIQHFSKQKV